MPKVELIPSERIEKAILLIRGQKVMLDSDLAELYGVATKRLNEQVRRNRARFPKDFMFQLTGKEAESLRSQNATLKKGRGRHRKYAPYAFTEQGVAMLSSVLNSERAIEVNIAIMRALNFRLFSRRFGSSWSGRHRPKKADESALRGIDSSQNALPQFPGPFPLRRFLP